MTKIRGLFIGRPGADIERQSRAFRDIGGEVEWVDSRDTGSIIEAIKDVDAAMSDTDTGGIDADAFKHMGLNGRCKGLVNLGHGYNAIDLAAANENGVIIANTASFGTEEVSNHALTLLLACSRKLVLHDRMMREGKWTRERLAPMGHIAGQTLGLIGAGNIGRATGRKALALGMHVLAFDPYIPAWDFKEYGFEPADSLDDLCLRADYVTLHPPLTGDTYHLIGSRQLAAMKPTAYLINCSRGPVVDEQALIRALRNGQIAGAGLDVFEQEPIDPDNPLLKMDNVTVTNHYASHSETAFDRVYVQMGEEAVRIATGSWPMSLVDTDVMSKLPTRLPARAWNVYVKELQARS